MQGNSGDNSMYKTKFSLQKSQPNKHQSFRSLQSLSSLSEIHFIYCFIYPLEFSVFNFALDKYLIKLIFLADVLVDQQVFLPPYAL